MPLILFAVLSSHAVAQVAQSAPPPIGEGGMATVYRDAHGVPHIVSDNERSAWYALGYEQARDGLLWIQYTCKAAKGELTWVRGDRDGLFNDMAVKIFKSHLGGKTQWQLQTMFSQGVDPSINGNFYDDCAAYAAGANAFRQVVATAPPSSPEGQLKAWFDNPSNAIPAGPIGGQPDLKWVYLDPIDPVDILSQGGWTTATMSLVTYPSAGKFVNSHGPSYADGSSPGQPEEVQPETLYDPLVPGAAQEILESYRQRLMAMPGAPSAMSGSNSFCWDKLFCQDGFDGYAGLVGDPHQGLPFYKANFPDAFKATPNHMWFAHVRVTPPGATLPSFDTFGQVPYGAASFFSSHNQSIAVGGTSGSPNFTDVFVLRLLEDPVTGQPDSAMAFYSYYHDDGNGEGPSDFVPVTGGENNRLSIRRPDGSIATVQYWRAESFGVILPDLGDAAIYVATQTPPEQQPLPVIFGERVDPVLGPPRHRATLRRSPDPVNGPIPPPPRMHYWREPQRNAVNQLTTSPMVVTLRAPMDAAVAGEDLHWLLIRDFWEITHASVVGAVPPKTNGAGYLANMCVVGRQGGTFSTQFSAIPQRGDDAALDAAEYTSMDKWLIYSLAAGPVPARHWADKMFDWRFGSYSNPAKPSPLLYLDYDWTLPVTRGQFKPSTLRLPTGGTFPNQTWGSFPPENHASGPPFSVQNVGFVSVCNDAIWGYSRKRDSLAYLGNPLPSPLPFNELVTGNSLLAITLDAGTLHQLQLLGLEAPDRQQIVVDQFTKQAELFYQSSGVPPLTPAQMREFVVSPRLYNEPSYQPPSGSGIVAHPELPPPIRQLKELTETPSQSPPDPASPRTAAQSEVNFFTDLWAALYGQSTDPNVNAGWAAHAIQGGTGTANLRDLWVNGGDTQNQPNHIDQIFWYSDPATPSTIRWIDMPHEFPLIDFMWTESELGRDLKAVNAQDGLAGEFGALQNLVDNCLETWQTGVPAADRYRNVPTSTGACLLQMMRMGYGGTGDTFSRHWVRLQRGSVRYTQGLVPLDSAGHLPNGSNGLVREYRPWSTLEGLAFPLDQLASLWRPSGIVPPYDALYTDVANRGVRASLRTQDVNALVEFFLSLGGHYVYPPHNANNPSRKLALFQRVGQDSGRFLGALPGTYPLTSGLARMTVARAALDAWDFMNQTTPPFSQFFRARAYDHNGQTLWPSSGADVDCVGGALRAVVWNEDSTDPGWIRDRGYQHKFVGMSGSYATMLTLFPSAGDPQSYFWCTPGVQAMGSDPVVGVDPHRYDTHMTAFSSNILLRTHFSDFTVNPASVTQHLY